MLNDLWDAGRRRGGSGSDDRRPDAGELALVTGGRGFVGAWLRRRSWSAASRSSRSTATREGAAVGARAARASRRRDDVEGDLATRSSCGGRWRTTRSTPSSTSRRRRSSAPRPTRRSRPSIPTSAGPGRCSRPAGSMGSSGSSSPPRTRPTAPTTSFPTARTSRFSHRAVRGLEGRRRPDRAQLLAHLRPAGRGDPVRQHLRRRGHQLLAADPGGGQRRPRRPRAGASLRRLAGARLPLRRGRGARLPGDRRRPRPRRGARPGLQRRRRSPACGGRGGGGDRRLAGTGVEPDVRGTGNPAGEIDRQYVDPTKIRELVGWQPEVDLEEGLRRTIDVVPGASRGARPGAALKKFVKACPKGSDFALACRIMKMSPLQRRNRMSPVVHRLRSARRDDRGPGRYAARDLTRKRKRKK